MKAKIKAISNLILPNHKINFFVLILFVIGFLSGAFFLTIINTDEKSIVINQITNFITNINNGTLDSISILKNNLITNLGYVLIMWILGLSIIGIVVNIFLIYMKGFILGFTLSSVVITYKIKGILFSLIYIFPNELLKILVTIILGVYSLTLSFCILRELMKKKDNNLRKIFKRYLVILGICIIIMLLSSMYEVYVLPIILNLVY